MSIAYLTKTDNEIDEAVQKQGGYRRKKGGIQYGTDKSYWQSSELKNFVRAWKAASTAVRNGRGSITAGYLMDVTTSLGEWRTQNRNEFANRRGGEHAAAINSAAREIVDFSRNNAEWFNGGWTVIDEAWHFTKEEKEAVRHMLWTTHGCHNVVHLPTKWVAGNSIRRAARRLRAAAGSRSTSYSSSASSSASHSGDLMDEALDELTGDFDMPGLPSVPAGILDLADGFTDGCEAVTSCLPFVGNISEIARCFKAANRARKSWLRKNRVDTACSFFSAGGFPAAMAAVNMATKKTAYQDMASAVARTALTAIRSCVDIPTGGGAGTAIDLCRQGAELIGTLAALAWEAKEKLETDELLRNVGALKAHQLNDRPILSSFILTQASPEVILGVYECMGAQVDPDEQCNWSNLRVIQDQCERILEGCKWKISTRAARRHSSMSIPSNFSDVSDTSGEEVFGGNFHDQFGARANLDREWPLYLPPRRRRRRVSSATSTASLVSNDSNYSYNSYDSYGTSS